jgi:peptidoglycan/xylan/chitin deacetylase (PgdA/CDA1 family)
LRKTRILIVVLFSILLTACSGTVRANIEPFDIESSTTITDTEIKLSPDITTLTNTPGENNPTSPRTPTNRFPEADKSVPIVTPISTDTPVPTIVKDFTYVPNSSIVAPILLYHQISNNGKGNRYYVTVEDFRRQMQTLRDLGYETITPSVLVNVLIHGGELPDRPVVITFDDGNLSVYQNAFPIMHEMDFVGTLYIYVDRLDSLDHVNVEQLQEMLDNGWEVGSHSMSHADLTDDSLIAPYELLQYELLQSRLTLEVAIDEPVVTFAYPYGRANSNIRGMISEYGYIAGMGLGPSWEHTPDTITYLSRIEVQSDYDLDIFKSLLPWADN